MENDFDPIIHNLTFKAEYTGSYPDPLHLINGIDTGVEVYNIDLVNYTQEQMIHYYRDRELYYIFDIIPKSTGSNE